jgi:hypothetical protein
MSAFPTLFNLTGGMQAIPGVSIYAVPPTAESGTGISTDMTPSAGTKAGSISPRPEKEPLSITGLLVVNTSPSHAKVYIDGVYYGMSPLRVEMEPGIHAVEVKQTKFKTVTEKVSVRKGDTTEMELSLER